MIRWPKFVLTPFSPASAIRALINSTAQQNGEITNESATWTLDISCSKIIRYLLNAALKQLALVAGEDCLHIRYQARGKMYFLDISLRETHCVSINNTAIFIHKVDFAWGTAMGKRQRR